MKIGDRLAVQIEGMDVGEAVIENIEDGLATIVIPATRLVVQVRQNLDFAATREPSGETVLIGTTDSEVEEPIPTPVVDNGDVGEGLHGRNLDSSAID